MAVKLQVAEYLLPVEGIELATCNAGIRYQGRDDMVLVAMAEGVEVAAVFTRNAFCAAPVTVCRQHLQQEPAIRYLLINAGNANAGTGEQGMQDAVACCQTVAEQFHAEPCQVLPFSTGVIGQPLPVDKIQAALPVLSSRLQKDNWQAAAKAILTTDTLPKAMSKQVELDGQLVTITGIAKGSGMIHPNMATMLAYVATDAGCANDLLQSMLSEVTEQSFNSITVDGDTSTNDALVLMATGQSGVQVSTENRAQFQKVLQEVCIFLAQAIVRDGEGATKFIDIQVEGAKSLAEARVVGNTVALSPLVKTAMFASDPNWGRILAAVGRAPIEQLDISKISIWLGDTLLIEAGNPASSYTEEQGQAEMNADEIKVRIQLQRGDVIAHTWTCDFSYDYVKINAEYRS